MKLRSSSRSTLVDHGPDQVWAVVACGRPGRRWYVDSAPLVVRSTLDRLVGGAGHRWPAPDRELLRAGDEVGFWRVTVADLRRLVLEADVRAPGTVTLTTSVTAEDSGTRLTQEVRFKPDGLLGQAYLLVDLPAREAVIELVHRRLLQDLTAPP